MLDPRESAILRSRTSRDLRQELMLLRSELKVCFSGKRKLFLESRIESINAILDERQAPEF